MTKQDNKTKLNQIVETSGITQSITLLRQGLVLYQQSENVLKDVYIIKRNLNNFDRMLKSLENQLTDLLEASELWESSEEN